MTLIIERIVASFLVLVGLSYLIQKWANFILKWSDEFLQRYIMISGAVITVIGLSLAFLTL